MSFHLMAWLFGQGVGNKLQSPLRSQKRISCFTDFTLFIVGSPRRPLLLYHKLPKNTKEAIFLRRGKKPTRKQKIRLGQAGLAPENWLIVKQKPGGELVILHKHTNTIRVIPALGQ